MNASVYGARVFVGDRRVDAIATNDRGIAYGDGLFETLRIHDGLAPWWNAHWARLERGAERLALPLPDQGLVRDQATSLLEGIDTGVIKLVVTRGSGGRGYALPSPAAPPTWLLSTHPLPAAPCAGGLMLRWCDTRLSIQPALAGIKHCNRLEQVLARAEWSGSAAAQGADEGLMLDTEDNVVCATAANLFALIDGRWTTPGVDRCGVAGVCRAWIMTGSGASEGRLSRRQAESAEAIFLCNAVRGILPVARLGDREWAPHPQVSALQHRLAAAVPMFATDD